MTDGRKAAGAGLAALLAVGGGARACGRGAHVATEVGALGRGAAEVGVAARGAGELGAAARGAREVGALGHGAPEVGALRLGEKGALGGDLARGAEVEGLGRAVRADEQLFQELAKALAQDGLEFAVELASPDDEPSPAAGPRLPAAQPPKGGLVALAVREGATRGALAPSERLGAWKAATATALVTACGASGPCVVVLCARDAAATCEADVEVALPRLRSLSGVPREIEDIASSVLVRALAKTPHASRLWVGRLHRAGAREVVWVRPQAAKP